MTEVVKKHEKWKEDFTSRDVLDTTYENNQLLKPFKTGKKLGVSYIKTAYEFGPKPTEVELVICFGIERVLDLSST